MNTFAKVLKFAALLWVMIVCPPLLRAQLTSLSDSLRTDSVTFYVEAQARAIREKRYEEAKEYLLKGIPMLREKRSRAMLLTNLGTVYRHLNQPDEALLSYSAALALDDLLADTRESRAMLYASEGKAQQAILDYSHLCHLYPENEVYHYRRAMLYIGERQYLKAETDFMHILERNSQSLKATEGLALVYTLSGQYDNAERLYDGLIEKLPDKPLGYEGRARMFLLSGKAGFALRDIDKAFERSPEPTAALYQLRAAINRAIGDGKAAKEDEAIADRMRGTSPL